MKPITRTEYLILLVVCVLTVAIILQKCDKKSEDGQVLTLYEHADDSLKYYKNKYGESTASMSLLQGTNANQLLQLKTNNETVKWLQQELGKYKDNVNGGGTIGVIGTVTNFSSTTTTSVTNHPVNNGYSLPTYETESKDSTWIKYKIVANSDSTHLDLKVKNKYTIVVGEEKVKGKLFKKQPVAFVTNKNPYTQITEMKVYEVTNKVRKRISLGVSAGYCVPLFSFKPQPYIGVGVSYNIINLW